MTYLTRLCVGLSVALSLAACDKGPVRGEAPTVAASPTTAPAPTGAAAPATASAPAATVDPAGTKYGAGVVAKETVTIDEILANPAAYNGKAVRVEGMVTDVCPKRGCWMELAGGKPGEKLRFKVDDGVMTFPMEAKGQYAVAEGVVAVRELTLEETRKRAEYEAKEYGKPYDPASITKPTSVVRIDGTGAMIRDRK